ncbi:MAG: dockerin type I repeat-containing protein, partial [bacterium]
CYGSGAAPGDPPDDQSTMIAFGKSNIPGLGTVSFGMAVFGLELPASPLADMNDLSIFVNKYAGFGRGDVNNDGVFDLQDLVYLSNYVADMVNNPGPVPFKHLGDVNADGAVDLLDVEYMEQYFFYYGPPPVGEFVF